MHLKNSPKIALNIHPEYSLKKFIQKIHPKISPNKFTWKIHSKIGQVPHASQGAQTPWGRQGPLGNSKQFTQKIHLKNSLRKLAKFPKHH